MNVKIYKLVGSTPNIDVDYYLGDAVYVGGSINYSFNLPPTTSDYQFYWYATDTAGNETYSDLIWYYNGQDGLQLRLTDEFLFLRGDVGLFLVR